MREKNAISMVTFLYKQIYKKNLNHGVLIFHDVGLHLMEDNANLLHDHFAVQTKIIGTGLSVSHGSQETEVRVAAQNLCNKKSLSRFCHLYDIVFWARILKDDWGCTLVPNTQIISPLAAWLWSLYHLYWSLIFPKTMASSKYWDIKCLVHWSINGYAFTFIDTSVNDSEYRHGKYCKNHDVSGHAPNLEITYWCVRTISPFSQRLLLYCSFCWFRRKNSRAPL